MEASSNEMVTDRVVIFLSLTFLPNIMQKSRNDSTLGHYRIIECRL